MKKNTSIKKIMSTEISTITTLTKLSETRSLFAELGVHHLPVVDGGNKLIGLLSFSDLLRVDSGELYKQDSKQADALIDNLSSVEEVMTSTLVTARPETTIREATEILSGGKFHSLPVVEPDGTLVGIVTSTDLLRYYLLAY